MALAPTFPPEMKGVERSVAVWFHLNGCHCFQSKAEVRWGIEWLFRRFPGPALERCTSFKRAQLEEYMAREELDRGAAGDGDHKGGGCNVSSSAADGSGAGGSKGTGSDAADGCMGKGTESKAADGKCGEGTK